MRHPEDRHVRAMRDLLAGARAENSRMVAAAIGGHLSRITREVGKDPELAEASDVVRDASLDLLRALHQGRDVNRARSEALKSVETLESALPDTAALKRLPATRSEPSPAAARSSAIRDFAKRRFSAVLPLWRN